MTVTAEVREELAKLNPSSIIELYEVTTCTRTHGVCEVYRFHAGVNAKQVSGHVIWADNIYYAWPVEAEGFEYTGNGSLPRPKIRIANVDATITAVLLEIAAFSYSADLAGARVVRIRTLARFLDAVNFENDTNPFGSPDATASLPEEVYFVDRKSAETSEIVEFELVSALDLAGVRVPKRQTINNICQWRYRSPECGYTGASYFDENDNATPNELADVCGKRLTSCEARFGANAVLPFGSFPGIGQYSF
jgi:lambda family phage minor tail protein L